MLAFHISIILKFLVAGSGESDALRKPSAGVSPDDGPSYGDSGSPPAPEPVPHGQCQPSGSLL